MREKERKIDERWGRRKIKIIVRVYDIIIDLRATDFYDQERLTKRSTDRLCSRKIKIKY